MPTNTAKPAAKKTSAAKTSATKSASAVAIPAVIPKNYRDTDLYLRADTATRRKLNYQFREQEARIEREKRAASHAAAKARFESNRKTVAAALLMKAQGLLARCESLGDESWHYVDLQNTPTDIIEALTVRWAGQPITDTEGFSGLPLVIEIEADGIEGFCYSSSSVNLETSDSEAFGRLERHLDQLVLAMTQFEEKFAKLKEEATREAREKLARNEQRAKMRASLTPEQAALISPDER